MNDRFNLIVPMVTNQLKGFPIEYQYNNEGVMKCVEAISWLPLKQFTDIYFIISKQADIEWHLETKIRWDLYRLLHEDKLSSNTNIKFIKLEDQTKSQVETIYKAVTQSHIEGSIFIKDADNSFKLNKIQSCNSVCIYSIEDCTVFEPQHKSYVSIDDNMLITNIIEKRVVSKYFNCGGYSFKDVNYFIEAYDHFKDYNDHVYLSHLIYYLMLVKKMLFTPEIATDYNDFTLECK